MENQNKKLIDKIVNDKGEINNLEKFKHLSLVGSTTFIGSTITSSILLMDYLNSTTFIGILGISSVITYPIFNYFKNDLENKIFKNEIIKKYNLDGLKIEDTDQRHILFKTINGIVDDSYKDLLDKKTQPLAIRAGFVDGYVQWIRDNNNKQPYLVMKFFTEEELRYIHNIDDEEMIKKRIYQKGGITDYKLISISDKKLVFINRPNSLNEMNQLESAILSLSNYLNKYSGFLFKNGGGEFELRFKNEVPIKEDFIETIIDDNGNKKDKFLTVEQSVYEDDKLYLGLNDKVDMTYVKTSKSPTDVRGLINGHLLIFGETGMGKSFGFKNIMRNWLRPETYQDIYKIYILDFKNGSDYNEFKKLDKVEYFGYSNEKADVEGALRMIKEVELHMITRNIYNSKNDCDNYPGQKILFITDEINKVQEQLSKGNTEPIINNSWRAIEAGYVNLASKGRSSNITLVSILQTATFDQLPGKKGFRNNNRHRIGYKNDNMNILFDDKLMDKLHIDYNNLKGGQFIYMDGSDKENTIIEGLTVGTDLVIDYDQLTKDNDSKADIDREQELSKFRTAAFLASNKEEEYLKQLKEDRKEVFIENLVELQEYKQKNFIEEALQELEGSENPDLSKMDINFDIKSEPQEENIHYPISKVVKKVYTKEDNESVELEITDFVKNIKSIIYDEEIIDVEISENEKKHNEISNYITNVKKFLLEYHGDETPYFKGI